MNTSLNLNSAEINKLNSNIKETKDSIYALLKEIDLNYSDLGTNVTGLSIKTLIDSIKLNIETITNIMAEPFDDLTKFLDKQVDNNKEEYHNALSVLTEAFAFIETNFNN